MKVRAVRWGIIVLALAAIEVVPRLDLVDPIATLPAQPESFLQSPGQLRLKPECRARTAAKRRNGPALTPSA